MGVKTHVCKSVEKSVLSFMRPKATSLQLISVNEGMFFIAAGQGVCRSREILQLVQIVWSTHQVVNNTGFNSIDQDLLIYVGILLHVLRVSMSRYVFLFCLFIFVKLDYPLV